MRVDEIEVLKAAMTGGLERVKRIMALVNAPDFEAPADRVLWLHIEGLALDGQDPELDAVLERLHREPAIGGWVFDKGDDYVWSMTKGRRTRGWILSLRRIALESIDSRADNPHIPEGTLQELRQHVERKTREWLAGR